MNKWDKAFWRDLGERVGSTLVYGLITWFSVTEAYNFSWEKLWPVVVLPAVLSALKGLGANMKNPASGASLLDPPPVVNPTPPVT